MNPQRRLPEHAMPRMTSMYLINNCVYLVQRMDIGHPPEWGYDTSHLGGKTAKILGCYNTKREAIRHAAAEVYRLDQMNSDGRPIEGSFDDMVTHGAEGNGPWSAEVPIGDGSRDVDYIRVQVTRLACSRYFTPEDHRGLLDEEDRGVDYDFDEMFGEDENFDPSAEPLLPEGRENSLLGRSFALYGQPAPHRRRSMESYIRQYGGHVVALYPIRREIQFVVAVAMPAGLQQEMARFGVSVLTPQDVFNFVQNARPGNLIARSRWAVYQSTPNPRCSLIPSWMTGAKVTIAPTQEPLSAQQLANAIKLCGGTVLTPEDQRLPNVVIMPSHFRIGLEPNGAERWTQKQLFENFPPNTLGAQYDLLRRIGITQPEMRARVALQLGIQDHGRAELVSASPAPIAQAIMTAPLPPAFEGPLGLPWGPDGCLIGLNFAFAGLQQPHTTEHYAAMLRGYGGRIVDFLPVTNETHCVITSELSPDYTTMISELGVPVLNQTQLSDRIRNLTLAFPRLDSRLNPSRSSDMEVSNSNERDEQQAVPTQSIAIAGVADNAAAEPDSSRSSEIEAEAPSALTSHNLAQPSNPTTLAAIVEAPTRRELNNADPVSSQQPSQNLSEPVIHANVSRQPLQTLSPNSSTNLGRRRDREGDEDGENENSRTPKRQRNEGRNEGGMSVGDAVFEAGSSSSRS